MNSFRDLKACEIETRVQSCTEKGVSLLLYKNARCDMAILDEVVGAEKWQRRHYECKGNLFCEVGIQFDSEWVWKSDCGSESNVEKEKGEASDSFKRACTNWGIGRELYTSPFIWIPAEKAKLSKNKNGNWACYEHFSVALIESSDHIIKKLSIMNDKTGEIVYSYGQKAETPKPPKTDKPKEPKVDNPPKPEGPSKKVLMWHEIQAYADTVGITPDKVLPALEKKFGTKLSEYTDEEFVTATRYLQQQIVTARENAKEKIGAF